MNNTKRIGILARTAIFVATLIWGSTFFIFKSSLDSLPMFFILAFRFFLGGIILSLIFFKRLKQLNLKYLLQGGLIGIFLALAYTFQTTGLQFTTPGKNAFLTAIYCVLVPFVLWLACKKRPDKYNVISAIVCIVGIGLVSLDGNMSVQKGDWLTLVGGVFFAVHIVFISKFNHDKDAILLTIIQFFTAGIICAVMSLCSETFPQHVDASAWWQVLYLAVFGTTVAMLLQNVGQKYTSPSSAAIILSFEAVFGAVFSIIFFAEALTLKLVMGFLLIFISVIVSETKLDFLKKKLPNLVDGEEKH